MKPRKPSGVLSIVCETTQHRLLFRPVPGLPDLDLVVAARIEVVHWKKVMIVVRWPHEVTRAVEQALRLVPQFHRSHGVSLFLSVAVAPSLGDSLSENRRGENAMHPAPAPPFGATVTGKFSQLPAPRSRLMPRRGPRIMSELQ